MSQDLITLLKDRFPLTDVETIARAIKNFLQRPETTRHPSPAESHETEPLNPYQVMEYG